MDEKMDVFEYINGYYDLNIKNGTKVLYRGITGEVTGASSCYVKIKMDGERCSLNYHPKTDGLVYVDECV